MNLLFSFLQLVALHTGIFIALKLAGAVTFSWLWVLSPLWIGAGIILFFLIGLIILGMSVSEWFSH
jgi:hypothetical protein